MNRSLLLLSCVSLGGCAAEPTALRHAGPRVKPELALVVPDEPVSSFATAPAPPLPDQRAVLIAPDVLAYPLAARQDPDHPDLMYGGSWAFRRTPAQWRLAPATKQEIALGPLIRENRQSLQPLQTQEMTALILEQRAQNDQNRQAISRLIRLQEDLQKQIGDLRAHVVSSPPSPSKSEDELSAPPRPSSPSDLGPKDPLRPAPSFTP
jgi:hypothetical protein